MNARGFTLVELLIATLVLLVLSAAAAALTTPVRDAFERNIAANDVVTRSRTAVDVLAADLRQAGAGLADVTAVTRPHRSLDDLGTTAPFTALTIRRATPGGARAALRQSTLAGDVTLYLEDAFSCAGTDRTCGFAAGTSAAVFDDVRLERIRIDAVVESASQLLLSAPMATSFSPGATVVALETTTYGTRGDSAGLRLVRMASSGIEQTLIDHVVRLQFTLDATPAPPTPGADAADPPAYGPHPPRPGEDDARDTWPAGENCTIAIDASGARIPRLATLDGSDTTVILNDVALQDGPWCPDAASPAAFDADLLRVRAVSVNMSVEVASAQLRGPASQLFGRGGTNTRAAQRVPDLELRITAMLRGRP